MIRKAMRLVVLMLAAVLAVGSLAEAAPRRPVRHRLHHTARASSAKAGSKARAKAHSANRGAAARAKAAKRSTKPH